MHDAISDVDVIIVPTVAAPADLITNATTNLLVSAPILTFPFSVTGQPAITVPCGFSPTTRMPLAMQIVGKPFAESTVLRVADAYQHETEWHLRAPATTGRAMGGDHDA
jgi:aspartyl-tRNA(Asn)/glutamyl-tRNA(Gln) amidotransferase subunit A